MKPFFNILEYIGLLIFERVLLLLGMRLSSHLFGTLFAIFGPFTPPSILAYKNIKFALPKFTFFQRIKIIIGMWNNLGRDLAEFIFLNNKPIKNINNFFSIDEKSKENLLKIKNDSNGVFVFLAHFGNWELMAQISLLYGIPFSTMYRRMNNPLTNSIMEKYRNKTILEMIDKKNNGSLKLIKALKKNKKIMIFLDQRDNHGIIVPLFNKPSKTSTTLATLSLKYNYKAYSIAIYRRHFYKTFFDVVIEEFEVKKTDNEKKDIKKNIIRMNKKYEEWIRKRPEQWFWVHNRWKNYKNDSKKNKITSKNRKLTKNKKNKS